MVSISQNVAIGRRKKSSARVFLRKGTGEITINGRTLDDYYRGQETAQMVVKQPLVTLNMLDKFDVKITAKGGGLVGQAYSIRLSLSRALMAYGKENGLCLPVVDISALTGTDDLQDSSEVSQEEETSCWRQKLKARGFMTRDARAKERKKPGLRKARKKPQFSKR